MESPYAHLEGDRLGEGTFTTRRAQVFLWVEATRNDEDAFRWQEASESYGEEKQLVPPEFGLQIVTGALDVDLAAVGLEPDWEAGVYHAGQSFDFHRPIYVDTTYAVSGKIDRIERKRGATGVFDVVTQGYIVTDTENAPTFTTETKIILMREE